MPQSQLMVSAVVYAQRANGRYTEARVLRDTCFTANFITVEFAQRLHLPVQSFDLVVGGMKSMRTASKGSTPYAKTDKGYSLNQLMVTGPLLQPKLFMHLLSIRFSQVVIMADIEQMYRQILVDPHDRRYQQILWQRDNKLEVFELNTVTFGISAAPYLAIRTLQQLADDEKHSFPRASVASRKNFYVDDFFYGVNTLDEVSQMRDEITNLLHTVDSTYVNGYPIILARSITSIERI